jgi:hypothetical protein
VGGQEAARQAGSGGGRGSSQAGGGESRKQKAGINQVGGKGGGRAEIIQVGEERRVGE